MHAHLVSLGLFTTGHFMRFLWSDSYPILKRPGVNSPQNTFEMDINLMLCVLTAAPFENRWWRFTTNQGSGFTDEMHISHEIYHIHTLKLSDFKSSVFAHGHSVPHLTCYETNQLRWNCQVTNSTQLNFIYKAPIKTTIVDQGAVRSVKKSTTLTIRTT